MDRNLLFKMARVLCISIGLLFLLSGRSFGQIATYTDGTLSTTIRIINSCISNPPQGNGALKFTINSSQGGAPVSLLVLGPVNLFPTPSVSPGSTYTFNAAQTLPPGTYNWLMGDGTNTIGSINDPIAYPPLVIADLSTAPLGITKDIEQNNASCAAQNGQVEATINGGSKTIGQGLYRYKWTSSNGTPTASGATNGASPLNLATLLGVSGLRGGIYDLQVFDSLSSCFTTASFTITDPSPTLYTVTTPSPLNVCAGDNITITLNNSEAGVTYEILRNVAPLPTPITFIGTASGTFTMTFPSTQFASGNNIAVRATNGFCTPVLMTNTVNLVINPIPTITGITIPSVCAGTMTTNLSYTGVTGSPNQYSIDYNAAAEAQGFTDIVNAAFPASPFALTIPAAAVAGTYSATLTVRNSVTACPSTAVPITITIIGNPTIALGANPSICIGTLTANLPYTATTGSPNQYSINFNPAAEAQGFVDVTSAALPATPIVIAIPPAAVAGTYNATITVVNTTSGCSSGTPQPITVTINSNPAVTLSAIPAICVGTTSVNLGYSAATGSPNQYSINYSAAAEAQGFTDVVNAALPATPIVLTVPAAAAAGTYTATVTVMNSLAGCTSPAQPISITINPSPAITITNPNPSVCIGTLSTTLAYTAAAGTPNQYSIDYNAAAEAQGFVDVVNAALPATPITVPIPGAAVAGTYNATLTVRNSTTSCSSTPQAITITINANPTITLGANPSLCLGSGPATLPYTATSGSPTQYRVDYNAAAEAQGFTDIVLTALPASPISLPIPGAAVAGTYNGTITVVNAASGCISAPLPFSITLNPIPTITGITIPSVCAGTTTTNLSYTGVTGSPNQYSIDYNAAAEAQGFTDIVNAAFPASPFALTIPAAAVAGTYNATLTVRNSVSGCAGVAVPVSVIILPNPAITLGANPSVCIGTLTANLPYSAPTGSPNQYSIDYNAAAEAQGFIDVVNAALPATPITVPIPAAAIAGTYNATLTVLNSTTSCISAAQAITITITTNPSITLGANPSLCIGSGPAALPYTSTTGAPTQYSVDYNAAAEAQGFTDITVTALPASPISLPIPAAAIAGTYNGTITVLNTASGCTSTPVAFGVTLNPTPTITGVAITDVCVGTTTTNVTYTGVTGSPNQFSVDFNAAAEAQGFTDIVNAALPASPYALTIPAGAVAGTYNASLTVRNGVAGCASVAVPVTITILGTPTISLGANPAVCIGTATANLPYTATTGSPNQYTIDFNAAAEAQGFVDVTNAALPASPVIIIIPAAAVAGTYNGTITVLNTTTGCASATPQPITITINPNAAITLGADPTVCPGATTANLPYTASVGSPDQYSINYDAAAEAAGFSDVTLTALPSSPIALTVPAAATAGTYNATITVINPVAGCSIAPQAFTVIITAPPTVTPGANPSVCMGSTSAGLPYSATGAPDRYSINYDASAEAQGFTDVVNAVLPASPIGMIIPAAALAGTYNATLTVSNLTSTCSSAAQAISVTLLSSPTGTITGTQTICTGSSANITVTFTGTGPWAFTYSDGTTTSPLIPSFFNTINIPVNPTATTTYTLITVADATPCPGVVNGSAVVTVNQAPQTNLAVGTTINPLCSGGISDVTVATSQTGVSYQLRNDADNSTVGAAVTGTGGTILLSTGVLTATTTFNVLATSVGCTSVELTNMATVTVSGAINAALAVTPAANPICAGSSTDLQVATSENGVLYQLRNDAGNVNIGAAIPGTGGTILLPTGILTTTTTFNVLASNGSCSIELADVETVTVSPSPNATLVVDVTIDPLCSGGVGEVTVELSQTGVTYQLRNDADDSAVGTAVAGTGTTITLPTGVLTTTTTFNVLATGPGCTAVELSTVATINVSGSINAGLALSATADPICGGTGTNIEIASSEAGISYQLRDASNLNIGAPVIGTGGTILLPTGNLASTTTFNVFASNASCSIVLTDTQTVNVDVAPDASLAVNATPNPLCVGGTSNVTVSLSQLGVSYQLRNDADDSNVGSAVIGTGAMINLPTGVLNATTDFNILATSGVCASTELSTVVTVNVAGTINAALTVSSSAATICANTSTFIQVLLSESGVNYQLRNDADDAAVGTPVAGTGGTINLPTGNLTTTMTFNVVANNGTCSIELTDKETITVSPSPTLTLGVTAAPALICSGTSTNIVVANSELGISYQLRNNAGNVLVGGPVAGTNGNISLSTGNLTANTTFNVLAIAGTCSAQLTALASVNIRPLGDPACGGGGSDCTNFSTIAPTIVTQPSCNDRDAGEVLFTISRADATPTTFRVIWTINGTTQTKFTSSNVAFDDLSSGAYQYTIIDEGNGKSCGPVDFFLDLKTQVEITAKQVTANVSCFGGTDGNVILTVDGTTTGEYWYTYVLDGTESFAQTFTPGAPLPGGLPADDQDFIILKVDDNFSFTCPDTVKVRIKHKFPKIDYAVASTNVTTCNGADGGIQVSAIAGGDSGAEALQIRLKKAVPFSTDPSGYVVVFDFEDVAGGTKSYADLSQGNYIVDVRDHLDCIQSKPIAIQAPGQVPLSSVSITAEDASCDNGGESGTINVSISDPGIYQVALSRDQINVPADSEFVNYNAPSLPSINFTNLASGAYYVYLKSSTTTCPTRTDAIMINGVMALADFDVLSNCGNVNLTLNNITGQQNAKFVIRVFSNDDKFFKIDSLVQNEIPLSNAVTFNYSPPTHTFLGSPATYRFVMVQTQTTGAGTCTLVSDTVVYQVRELLGITLGQVKPSFPEPKHTGSIEIANITGGTRFVSPTNELYYEISLTTADDDIVILDWEQLKLDPQNKFMKLYEYLPPGVYRVKVRDAAGCIKTMDVELPLDPSVYVPNFFTPNEDNINDEFEILNLPVGGTHKLIITNRWGNQVFSSNDYRDGNFWDAEEISDGIYYYRLKVEGGETYTGWVEILRGSKP